MNEQDLPFVSIIILNYNHKKYLLQCLRSIEQLDYPQEKYEVILADNSSTDDSLDFVSGIAPWIRVIRLKRNYGFAGGNNRAAKFAGGKYVAFVNPDTEVDSGWLIELVKNMEKYPEVASCGGKVLFSKERDVIQNAGHKMTLIGIPYAIGYCEKDRGQFQVARHTLAASGCAMLADRKVFEEIGGFDEDYFLYVEEGDLGLRFWLHGFKVMYIPTAVAYHELGAWAEGKTTPEHVLFYQKNMIITITKNFEFMKNLEGLCLLMVYDVVKSIHFIRNNEFDCVLGILRGLSNSVKELPKTLSKRRDIQKTRRLSDKELCSLGLVMPMSESLSELFRAQKIRT